MAGARNLFYVNFIAVVYREFKGVATILQCMQSIRTHEYRRPMGLS
jgi:transcriptional regulator NrdR family protein